MNDFSRLLKYGDLLELPQVGHTDFSTSIVGTLLFFDPLGRPRFGIDYSKYVTRLRRVRLSSDFFGCVSPDTPREPSPESFTPTTLAATQAPAIQSRK